MTTVATKTGLSVVRDEIARACREAKRDPAGVTLVAVSKTFGAEAIAPVIAAGHRTFGENRVQEAKAKWPALRERHPGLELHMIGPLQSNKAREAVELFDQLRPDVVFLDVHMPGISGVDAARTIGPLAQIVFETAFEQYAVQAF